MSLFPFDFIGSAKFFYRISDKDNKLLVANDLLAQPVAVIEPPAKRKKLSTGEVLRKTTDNVAAKVAAAKVSGSNNAKNDAKRAKPVVGAALTAPTTRDSRVSTPLHTTSSVVVVNYFCFEEGWLTINVCFIGYLSFKKFVIYFCNIV